MIGYDTFNIMSRRRIAQEWVTRETVNTQFISLLSLVYYVTTENYENQIHLIFITDGFPEIVLNETASLLKAEITQRQFDFKKEIRLIEPSFGTKHNLENVPSQDENERMVIENVENIMKIDIKLLKFIASVPDRLKRNGLEIPDNADKVFLFNKYLNAKESIIVNNIYGAYKLYTMKNKNEKFVKTSTIDSVTFDNTNYTYRSKKVDIVYTDVGNRSHYNLLIQLVDYFYSNSETRKCMSGDPSKLPIKDLKIPLEFRSFMYEMACTLPVKSIRRDLQNFFDSSDSNSSASNKTSMKKRTLQYNLSERLCEKGTKNMLILIIYFMIVEECDKSETHEHINDSLINYRNELIKILLRMIEDLIKYIQFKAINKDSNVIIYSELPLIDIPEIDNVKQPISYLVYLMQYALNFAPFLCNRTTI